jgi:archaemetzincin
MQIIPISHRGFKNVLRIVFLAIVSAVVFSFNQNEAAKSSKKPVLKTTVKNEKITIIIQPFADLSRSDLKYVTKELRKYYKKIKVNSPIEFPKSTLNQSGARHRADLLIRFLSDRTPKGYLTIGLTTKDISTTKGKFADWGVMGLGFCPGKSCIASSFRLKGTNKLDKLVKVSLHELGHTQGLPHCPVNKCIMQDAKRKDRWNQKKGFCAKCKAVLIKAGWVLK